MTLGRPAAEWGFETREGTLMKDTLGAGAGEAKARGAGAN